MNYRFSKGFESGEAIRDAMRLPAGPGRQAALNKLKRRGNIKLVSPQAGNINEIPEDLLEQVIGNAPQDDGEQMAAHIAEVGALQLLRDVPEESWDPLILGELDKFKLATPWGFFRLRGDSIPGYGSKFVDQTVPLGWNNTFLWFAAQRSGSYGKTQEEHQQLQRGQDLGFQGFGTIASKPENLAGCASFAHQDQPYLAFLFIACQLAAAKAPLSGLFPILPNEVGFVSYGGAVDLQCAIAEVTRIAMQWCWALKYDRNRARPEELWPLAFRGQLHPSLHAKAPTILSRVGPYLGMRYVEGSPCHPADPSGHATIAGACATLLSAWFQDGPVTGLNINSLHAELRHAAWNLLTLGRMVSGVHFRSDCETGLLVGQRAAIEYLKARKQAESTGSTTFQGFFNSTIVIS
jgi:membrane-associated phospholipid phosphatase